MAHPIPSTALPVLDRPSPSFGSRFGTPIDLVVIHTTEGAFDGAVAWLTNVEVQASAHYVVAPDGRIACLVDERNSAWHAGNPDYNRRSIGIELATVTRDAKGHLVPNAFPGRLLETAAALVADVCRRRSIPVLRAAIIGHDEVPDPLDPLRKGGRHHHTDPGPAFPWPDFLDLVESKIPNLGGVA